MNVAARAAPVLSVAARAASMWPPLFQELVSEVELHRLALVALVVTATQVELSHQTSQDYL